MANLNPLIRMRKHTVDQKQKALAELYRQSEELQAKKKHLLDQVEYERNAMIAASSVETVIFFGRYSEVVKHQVEGIDEALTKLEVRIEVAREDMRSAFAELKKIEITQEAREAAEEKELNKRETALLDDIAIEGFRRTKQDEL